MADWRARLENEAEPVYPIGVVAELPEVSVQVVRRYDQPDLVAPERTARPPPPLSTTDGHPGRTRVAWALRSRPSRT